MKKLKQKIFFLKVWAGNLCAQYAGEHIIPGKTRYICSTVQRDRIPYFTSWEQGKAVTGFEPTHEIAHGADRPTMPPVVLRFRCLAVPLLKKKKRIVSETQLLKEKQNK